MIMRANTGIFSVVAARAIGEVEVQPGTSGRCVRIDFNGDDDGDVDALGELVGGNQRHAVVSFAKA